jgi:hypothetical protein
MNNLSILIYFAGAVSNLGAFFATITALLMVPMIGSIIFWLVYHDETDSSFRSYTGDALVECRKTRELWRKRAVKFALLAVFTGLICNFIPTRQTVLLIAGSEMGEKVLNSEKVTNVVDPGIELITTWMKNETAEIKKKMETKQ